MTYQDRPLLGSDIPSRTRLLPPKWLWILILVYVLVFSVLSVLKHDTFHSYILDLGIMSQVLWNTAQGRLFETSLGRPLNSELVGSYLGNHVRPILLLLAPLYRLWPAPDLLLILQSAVLALGAVPLFWIVQRELRSPWLRGGLVVSYLLYPALGYLNLFDFHPVALSVPATFFAYWALQEKRKVLFWSAALLALATKEEMVVPVAAFAIYCMARPQWRKSGLILLILTILWAYICFAVIIPRYNEGRPYRFAALWSHLLPTKLEGQSGRVDGLQFLFSVDSLYFFVHLFLPLGFLPLLGPGLLAVSVPSLIYLLLSSRPAHHRIGFQYPAVLIPWLFLAAVQGLKRLEHWPVARRMVREWLPLLLMLVGTLGGNLAFSPLRFHWFNGAFSSLPHHKQIEAAMAQIPPQAGVATINTLGPHLAHRRHLIGLDGYPLPLRQDHLQHVDYVLLDLVDCRAFEVPEPRATYTAMTRELLDMQEFGVRYWSDRILLLERGIPAGSELDEVRAYVERLVAEGRPCWP